MEPLLDCTVTVEVYLDTKLFESVELYSGDGLQIGDCLVLTLWERLSMFTFEVSQNTKIFNSVQLYLRDTVEMAGHLAMALERDFLVTVQSLGTELFELVEVYSRDSLKCRPLDGDTGGRDCTFTIEVF